MSRTASQRLGRFLRRPVTMNRRRLGLSVRLFPFDWWVVWVPVAARRRASPEFSPMTEAHPAVNDTHDLDETGPWERRPRHGAAAVGAFCSVLERFVCVGERGVIQE